MKHATIDDVGKEIVAEMALEVKSFLQSVESLTDGSGAVSTKSATDAFCAAKHGIKCRSR